MIAREWRGATRTADHAAYLEYMEATGLRAYRATPGNVGVQVLTRELGPLTQFVLLSYWDTLESVVRFAGPDPLTAVFYSEDDRYLVERDLLVQHYEVALTSQGNDTDKRREALARIPGSLL